MLSAQLAAKNIRAVAILAMWLTTLGECILYLEKQTVMIYLVVAQATLIHGNQVLAQSVLSLKKPLQYDSTSQKKKQLDEALAIMIATDYQPFNIVEITDFRKFIQLLDLKYVLSSKFTVKENLMKNIFFQTKNKLKQVL